MKSITLKINYVVVVKILLILAFFVFLQDGFATQVESLVRSENPARNLMVFSATWCLAIVSVVLVSLINNKYVRAFWGVFFLISVFAYLSFSGIMGYTPSLGDAKTLFIEMGQANAALLTYWSELIVPFLMSLFLFFIIAFKDRSIDRLQKSWISTIALVLPVLPITMISGMLILKGGAASVGMPGGLFLPSSYMASIFYESITEKSIKRNDVKIAANEPLIKNIILVVDESVSGDFINFSQNYSITPILTENRSLVADFGRASSGHNCSSFSNAALRWGISPSSLSQAFTLPTVWQYAKKAGFVTTYIDSQKQPGSYSNFMNLSEAKKIDNYIQFKSPQVERDMEYISNDFKAAEIAIEKIHKSETNFIYINKLGAHFPYEGKYPESEAVFKPHQELFQPLNNSTKEEVINSYKNVIAWNLDKFFEKLFNSDILDSTLIIYTSDHGQNIFEGTTITTHCNREANAPYQAWVPLLVITKNKLLLDRFKQFSKQNYNRASHFNIFPTILILMGYSQAEVEPEYTQSFLAPISRLGKYLAGNIFSKSNRVWKAFPDQIPSRLQASDGSN